MGCTMSFAKAIRTIDQIEFEGFERDVVITPEIIQLVKDSWNQLLIPTEEMKRQHISPATLFYDYFYGYLGERCPATDHIFYGTGFKTRADSLIKMISSTVVIAVKPGSEADDGFAKCAAYHAMKGIDASHFGPVIHAMIYALEKILGDEFTPEIRDAWMKLYSHATVKMAPSMPLTEPAQPEPLPPTSAAEQQSEQEQENQNTNQLINQSTDVQSDDKEQSKVCDPVVELSRKTIDEPLLTRATSEVSQNDTEEGQDRPMLPPAVRQTAVLA